MDDDGAAGGGRSGCDDSGIMMSTADTTQPPDECQEMLPSGLDPHADSPQMPHTVDLRAPYLHNSLDDQVEAAVPMLHLSEHALGVHGNQSDLDPRLDHPALHHRLDHPALDPHLDHAALDPRLDHPALSNQNTASFAPDNVMAADLGAALQPVPSVAMLAGQDTSDGFWFGSDILDYMDCFGSDVLPSPPVSQQPGSQQSNTFPRERYSQVQRLWPTRKSFAKAFSPNIWDDVVRHKSGNILSDPGIHDAPSHPLADASERHMSTWAMDDDRRQMLIRYAELNCMSSTTDMNSGHRHQTDSLQARCDGARLPPTRLLNLALAMAFRRFQTLVPFIHQPTFSVKTAPDSIVFPLCLLGLVVLDSEQTKAFVLRYMGEALRRCYKDLSQCFCERKASWKTIVSLTSATLLLTTLSICGESARRDETQAEMLYNHTISLAQLSGMFTPDFDRASSRDTFLSIQARFHAQRIDEECLWKAWARIESTKRMITSLYMMDAWWAYSIRISPLIHSKAIHLELPCSTELFQCRSAMAWRRTLRSGHAIDTCPLTLQLESPMTGVSARMIPQDMCPTAMTGVLCMIWIYILELQDWQLHYQFRPPQNLLALDGATGSLGKILIDLQHQHGQIFKNQDANCMTLWHFLNLNLFSHLSTFELAAGRKGADSARVALVEIAAWGRTKSARRACLHAAGIHRSMSRRRTGEGTMFHSESALFSAALVVGLYVFTAQGDPEHAEMSSLTGPQVEPYELLDDVDWSVLEQVTGSGSDVSVGADSRRKTPAASFVNYGGNVTFSGINCRGGYDAAKTILLEYASLLEEVGKWNAKRLCQILMTLSDSLLDVED